jgi:hypothetical protein
MSEKIDQNAAPSDRTPGWADLWQSFSESSKQVADAWSSSMAPFMLTRLLEHPQGFAAGNEMSEAIEKMAQGPRLADVWDIDRKMALVFGAWMDMRQKLATDNGKKPPPEWREAFAKWSEISNEELIRNQRSDGFLRAQKELLQSGLKLRGRQDDVAEAAATMFGIPGRKDFDEVTRQLTELRREVRALSHQVDAQQRGSRSARPRADDPVASSESQPNAQRDLT